MREAKLTVKHQVGLHARPAAKFVKLIKGFESDVQIKNLTRGGPTVSAKSLVRLVKIAVAQGHEIHVTVDGPDENDAIKAIRSFIDNVMEEQQ